METGWASPAACTWYCKGSPPGPRCHSWCSRHSRPRVCPRLPKNPETPSSQRSEVRASGPGLFLTSVFPQSQAVCPSAISPTLLVISQHDLRATSEKVLGSLEHSLEPSACSKPLPSALIPRALLRDLFPNAHSARPLTPDFCSRSPLHARSSPITTSSGPLAVTPASPLSAPHLGSSPGLPGSILALLMLMEVSTPGRRLKPESSIKAGSSRSCTITRAPVTVDSSGMKSFCSVRSVRDRPGEKGGWRRWDRARGQGTLVERSIRVWKPILPPCLVSKPPKAASSGRPTNGFGHP